MATFSGKMNAFHIITTAFFLMTVSHVSYSDWKFESNEEKYRDILLTAESLNLGFPFNDKRHLTDRTTLAIGERIKELHQNGFLTEGKRKGVLREIIDNNWKTIKKLPLEGYMNMGFIEWQEPECDVYLLFAALFIVSKTGEIEDIAPFLEFSKVYFGHITEAVQIPPYQTSVAWEFLNTDLTDIQRKSFWPASSAILNHATTTIPLLKTAVQDTKLAELLRLRAAAYLREMAPEVLNEEFIGKCEEPIAKKIRCIIEKKGTWDGVDIDICEAPDAETVRKMNQKMMDTFDAMRNQRMRAPRPQQ